MFNRRIQSPVGDFSFNIDIPKPLEDRWITTLKIESPIEEPRILPCPGSDALDAVLYAVKLAALNVQNFRQDGIDLRWLNDEYCGFDYRTLS